MEIFFGKYFPREMRKFKVEEFINLKKTHMSVEEYSLNFSMISKYAPSLLSNTRDKMSRFVTRVADLVYELCRTVMLHDDMSVD